MSKLEWSACECSDELGGDVTGSAGASPASENNSAEGDRVSATETPSNPWYSRGYLPHCDEPGLVQFINFRLADSLPKDLVARWRDEVSTLPEGKRKSEMHSRIMKFTDQGSGSGALRRADVARIVEDTLLHSDGDRYRLLAWVIMPNHVHLLAELAQESHLGPVTGSWKSISSHKINAHLGRAGTLWEREFYDRYIRDRDHLNRVLNYIDWNPAKAGLCASPGAWRWSSAWRREHEGLDS